MTTKTYKIFTFIILFIVSTFLLISCSNSTASSIEQIKTDHSGKYTKISSKTAKSYIDMAYEDDLIKSGDFVILDVRTLSEYEEGHIKDAILVPNETIGTTKPIKLPKTDAIILVYCRSGNRSAQAAKKLIDLGYQYVYDFGGIGSWTYGTVK